MTETPSHATWPGMQLLWEWNKEPELKLSLEIRMSDDVAVVTCKGRIVFRNEAAALSYTVAELLPQARQLVLELSEVETMDGAGLGELLALLACAQASGCSMKLAAPSKGVRELLELTRVASVFEIHPTVDDALLAAHVQV
jgi:anti-sigma B factor antagonist